MRRLVIVPVLVLAAAALAACGSSSSSSGSGGSGSDPYGGGSSSSASSAPAAAGGDAVALAAKDFAFTPTSLSVPAGAASIKLTNNGSVEHNLTIEGTDVSKDAEAGESATAKVDLQAGTYQFHCKYHPTQMKGTITVG